MNPATVDAAVPGEAICSYDFNQTSDTSWCLDLVEVPIDVETALDCREARIGILCWVTAQWHSA
jgi:hypothetical protein